MILCPRLRPLILIGLGVFSFFLFANSGLALAEYPAKIRFYRRKSMAGPSGIPLKDCRVRRLRARIIN